MPGDHKSWLAPCNELGAVFQCVWIYLEHGELQEDAPAGPQDMSILIRGLSCRLAICVPNLLQESPCSSMDTAI